MSREFKQRSGARLGAVHRRETKRPILLKESARGHSSEDVSSNAGLLVQELQNSFRESRRVDEPEMNNHSDSAGALLPSELFEKARHQDLSKIEIAKLFIIIII